MINLQTINNHVKDWRYTIIAALVIIISFGVIRITQTSDSTTAQATNSSVTQSTTSQQTKNTSERSQLASVGNVSASTTTSSKTTTEPQSTTTDSHTDTRPSNPKELFANLNLSAESVAVWDRSENKMIYERKANEEQPLASLTKLMTALVATENTTSSTTATINQHHLNAVGEYGLEAGETWPIDELISFMLVRSANDAARAVASATTNDTGDGYASKFVDIMNRTATRLGLSDTYFFNPSGLDINEELISGGYSNARDAVRLFDYISSNYPDLLAPTTKQSVQTHSSSGQHYTVKNTNDDIKLYPSTFGSKTGYTVLAGGNLIMGFDLKDPVIIALFGSTKEGRFADMQQLHQATKRYLTITD